jgi:glyoxylase-like metal-dependent hydrolase (beta-lactamase superfamily II)
MTTVNIGKYAITKVVELERPFAPAREFFPDLTAEMLEICQRELPAGQLTPDGYVNMSYHTFVVRTDRFTMLVDTSCGNHKERATRPDFHHLNTNFLGTLAEAGVKPEEVDYVLCTHLHWDHVGWNTQLIDGRWVPTFPNAKHIISRTEYDFWDAAYRRGDPSIHCVGFADSILPVKKAEQVVLVDDNYQFDSGIILEPCFGHSPGHVVVNIADQGDRGVVAGDVIHHQIQFRFPSMSTKADTDPNLARKTRTALIERHAGTGSLLLPAHFQTPTFGRIEKATEGYRYDPVA